MQENLRKFVYSQFRINLKLMPHQSTRHLYNKTRFNRAAHTVSWSLEIVFHLNTNELFRFNTKSQLYPSNQTLKSILNQFYNDFKAELFENTRAKEIKYRHLYETFDKSFNKKNYDDINVLFEIIDMNMKQKYYVKFNLEHNLENLLIQKSFIEYPTLFIVKTNDLDKYELRNNIEQKEESNQSANMETESIQPDGSKKDEIPIENGHSNELFLKEKRANLDDLEDGECDDSDEEVEYKDSKRTINGDMDSDSCKKLKS
jgi:hypothetical protein